MDSWMGLLQACYLPGSTTSSVASRGIHRNKLEIPTNSKGCSMLRSLIAFLLFGFLVHAVSAQAWATDRAGPQNLRNCLDGLRPCNRSLLTSEQVREIDELKHD